MGHLCCREGHSTNLIQENLRIAEIAVTSNLILSVVSIEMRFYMH